MGSAHRPVIKLPLTSQKMLSRDCARGILVSVEGLDRSGKTTQVRMLRGELERQGFSVVALQLPDRSSSTGAFIDRHLKGVETVPKEHLHTLFVENRREVEPLIRESVASGKVVIVDRYSHSGIAYGAASGLSPVQCAMDETGLPHPDIVIFLDVTPGLASQRAGYGEELYENTEFQLAVREQFSRMMDDSWFVVNGAKSVTDIHAVIFERVIACVRAIDRSNAPLASF